MIQLIDECDQTLPNLTLKTDSGQATIPKTLLIFEKLKESGTIPQKQEKPETSEEDCSEISSKS